MNDPNNKTSEICADGDIAFDGILSKDDARKLWEAVRRDGAIDEQEATRLVEWAINIRTAKGCLDLLLEGFVTVNSWNGDEPNFGLPKDALNAFDSWDFSIPMLEETK